jgi:hypothetical protein
MIRHPNPTGRPGGSLRAARDRLAGGGILVADERVADAFTAPGDATERLMYGWSILHCLPATLGRGPRRGDRHRPAGADAGPLGGRGRVHRR